VRLQKDETEDFLKEEFFGGEDGHKQHNTCPTLPVRVLKTFAVLEHRQTPYFGRL